MGEIQGPPARALTWRTGAAVNMRIAAAILMGRGKVAPEPLPGE
jgi:hypothetical protein